MFELATPPAPTGKVHRAIRLLVEFGIDGDLRFISHRDTMRMLVRAMTRADWPLAYSQGFNPHVRLSMLLPRAVGMATVCDPAIVQVTETLDLERGIAALAAQMPAGACVGSVRVLEPGEKPRPAAVSYRVGPIPSAVDLAERVAAVLAAERLLTAPRVRPGRKKPKKHKEHDLRPFIRALVVRDDHLYLEAWVQDGRSATPRDVLAAMALPAEGLVHRILRTGIEM